MNILCIGDIVGKPGRNAVVGLLKSLREEYAIDFVVANAENAAGGAGVTERIAKHLLKEGCDVLTLGDHTWDQKETEEFLPKMDRVIRPANFPEGTPGHGFCIHTTSDGVKIGVINIIGRTFMRYQVDCPFRAATALVERVRQETPIIVVDFHAETTSEKTAMGHFLNGKVSAVVGTHTHIQTADEKILSDGTAHITDLGMTGPYDSVIGQKKEQIIERFLTSRPIRFSVAEDDVRLCGVVVTVDKKTGRAKKIVRIQKSFIETAATKQQTLS